MVYGIIDLGANSVRLTVYQYDNDNLKILLSKKCTAGLLAYIDAGELNPKGVQKACAVLKDFGEALYHLHIDEVYAFASVPFRSITNAGEAVKRIQEATGMTIDVLSGEEEARLSYLGASQSMTMPSGLFADVGGGSTELVQFENGAVKRALDVPFGSLNLSLKYVKGITPHKSNILDIKQELRRELKRTKLFEQDAPMNLCAVGGTARASLRLYNDIHGLSADNTIMEAESFAGLLIKYNEERRDILMRLKQLAPDRMHTVIPGIVIMQTLSSLAESKYIIVNACGVREGYLLGRVLKKTVN